MKPIIAWAGLALTTVLAVACGTSISTGGGGAGGGGGGGGGIKGTGGSMATYVSCGSAIEPVFMPDPCPEGTATECCMPDGCCCQCPPDWSSSASGNGAGGGAADAGAD